MPTPKRRRRAVKLDTQQIEILGRNRVKAALIEAGLEVATPERDNGVDLIAYRWNAKDLFSAVPMQLKTATAFSFAVDRKYERIPNLVMAFVMDVREDAHSIYALTYRDALGIAKKLGWTRTASWRKGRLYRVGHESKRIEELLAPHEMKTDRWVDLFNRAAGL